MVDFSEKFVCECEEKSKSRDIRSGYQLRISKEKRAVGRMEDSSF